MQININSILLYSVTTCLADEIDRRFYGGVHFVWCSPVFNPRELDRRNEFARIPPSSSPYHIYKTYYDDVTHQDQQSNRIKQNKEGIRRGALIKKDHKEISAWQFKDIQDIIDSAELADFKPLIYVIPVQKVKKNCKG